MPYDFDMDYLYEELDNGLSIAEIIKQNRADFPVAHYGLPWVHRFSCLGTESTFIKFRLKRVKK